MACFATDEVRDSIGSSGATCSPSRSDSPDSSLNQGFDAVRHAPADPIRYIFDTPAPCRQTATRTDGGERYWEPIPPPGRRRSTRQARPGGGPDGRARRRHDSIEGEVVRPGPAGVEPGPEKGKNRS